MWLKKHKKLSLQQNITALHSAREVFAKDFKQFSSRLTDEKLMKNVIYLVLKARQYLLIAGKQHNLRRIVEEEENSSDFIGVISSELF
jgi:hypothetical protein